RHVFQGVHGQVGTAVEQGSFELFDEQALAAHLGQGAVENLVATRGKRKQFDRASGVQGAKTVTHMLGLPKGKPAGACGNDETLRRGHERRQARLEKMTAAMMPMMASTVSP